MYFSQSEAISLIIGKMVTILMVAEKPSIAGSIATALSGKTHQTRSGKTPVHEFEGKFRGNAANYKVRGNDLNGSMQFKCYFKGYIGHRTYI